MSVIHTATDGTVTERFKGAVIADRERNFHDDSDFYVVAWDEAAGKLVTHEYATTRFSCIGCGASVDATEEVLAKANAWAYAEMKPLAWSRYVKSLKTPEKGDTVKVVKGRKVPVGTTGTLFWIGQ